MPKWNNYQEVRLQILEAYRHFEPVEELETIEGTVLQKTREILRNIVESSWSAKLDPKWEGPYYIASIKGITYQLRRKSGIILPFTVHRNRLKKYHDAKVEQLPGGATSDP